MPYRPPPADPAPRDGALPATALAQLGTRPFGVYVHVPFCLTRCGYCDFNTYTADEASRAGFADAVIAELDIAARVVGAPRADTVFFGGGTPTLLPADELARILRAIEERFGAATEVTTEANPESVDPASLAALRDAGFTRISLGMQSAAPHVLATLDRTHTPGRAGAAAVEARAAGFEHVSLDLIYGTPGETQEDWRASLEAALNAQPDHVSAYALIVEPGTRLHAQVARGALAAPDDDAMADRYELADALLGGAGLAWYELSNWATTADAQCHHNLGYWRSADWWGAGPGAHSHVGGVRWWNVLHPSAYAKALGAGSSPAAGRELLDDETRRFERIMLELRLREGLDLALVDAAVAAQLAADGLLELRDDRAVLTLEGRLKADAVTRALTS
jgi:oxygen-independent coproporphyrinogen-3 oxidase